MEDSQGLNLSLQERVRRQLILTGILPKLTDLGQGAIGEAIEAAGAGQFGRLHKEALSCTAALGTIYDLGKSIVKITTLDLVKRLRHFGKRKISLYWMFAETFRQLI